MFGTEGRKQFPFPLEKSSVKFDVLQSRVVDIGSQKAHDEIESMPHDHQQRSEDREQNISAREKVHGILRNDLRDDRARKHESVKPCIA